MIALDVLRVRALALLCSMAPVAASTPIAGNTTVVSYEASLGTLPPAQGWPLFGSASPAPVVLAGLLKQGPTTVNALQCWQRTDMDNDFSTAAGFTVEFRVRIIESDYWISNAAEQHWRTGYMYLGTDRDRRVAAVGISATGVRISTHGNHPASSSSPLIPFDTTSQLNTYRLTANASGVALSINGVSIASLPLGATDPAATQNYHWFGDGTGQAGNMSELAYVRWLDTQSVAYCTAGTTSNGCVPSMTGSGVPRANAASGFTLNATAVEGMKTGLIFYGVSGRLATPWHGGVSTSFLCVKPPTQRLTSLNSGGTSGACDGVLSIDWNAYMAANPSALGQPLQVGQVVNAQAWFRDPPAPEQTNLSNGLEFTTSP